MSQIIPVKRPNHGTVGRSTKVLVNYFKISHPKGTWFKYAVEIKKPFMDNVGNRPYREPRPVKIEIKRKVFYALEKKKGDTWFNGLNYFFDGENTLYTTSPIQMDTSPLKTSILLQDDQDLNGNPNEYQIQIIEITEPLSLNDLDVYLQARTFQWENFNMESLRALNHLVHVTPSYKYFRFYDSILDPNTRKSIGRGMELWFGFFESVRPGENSYFVNVNKTHRVCYEKIALDKFLCAYLNKSRLPPTFDAGTMERINKVLRNMKVRPLHRPKVKTQKTLLRISQKKATEHEFMLKGTKTNVYQYFQKTYDIKLKYQHVVEIAGKDEVWPIECCEIIEGQRVPLDQMTGDQIAEIIKIAAIPPKRSMDDIIREGVGRILDIGNDPKLKQFNTEIEENMTVVPARMQKSPNILYHSESTGGATVMPKDGAWNLRGKQFIGSGRPLESWFVISFVPEEFLPREEAEDFIVTLVGTCKTQGVRVEMEQPRIKYPSVSPTSDFKQVIQQEFNNSRKFLEKEPELILFLVPPDTRNTKKRKKFPDNYYDRKMNQQLYRDIKYVTGTILGIPSQCVKADNVFEGPSYCANLALKINLKLDGTNSILGPSEIRDLTDEPVLILGADVTHPSKTENIPSVCAVVGSVDRYGSRYIDRHCEQPRTRKGTQNVAEERILEMRGMVREILTEFKQRNRLLPKRIIMYRDGVSESQYKMVLENELRAIQDACRDMKEQAPYEPPVTFIIVGKRHHTRFYPLNHKSDADRKGNCLPGLTVDREITHPYLFDFFITSHASLQGTSRPTHYVVLHNDNKFSADKLQEFTYKMCYNYQRATRSVSIPPPVFYAHLVAKQARLHIAPRNGVMALRPLHKDLARKSPMYYM